MLHTNSLLRSILLDAWLIDAAYADAMLPIVIDWLEGKNTHSKNTQHEKSMPFLLTASGNSLLTGSGGDFNGFASAEKGSAIIPIRGAITKYDGLCNYGVETYSKWIQDAERSENVESIVLLIDSPGGQANASFFLADQIARIEKPTLAYIDGGMAASGAYLIASAADKIFAATPVDMFGSIGAMVSLVDYQPRLAGTKVWEIYSRLSSEKNAEWRRLKENNDTSLIQDWLDITVGHFIGSVKKNRPNIHIEKNDPFKGATYTADVALSIGLIDGIGDMNEAISAIRNEKKSTSIDMNWKEKLINWMKAQPDEEAEEATEVIESAETTADATGDTAEQIEEPSVADLSAELVELRNSVQTLTAENQSLQEQVASLTEQLAEKPAANPTTPLVAKEEEVKPVETPEEALSFLSETDMELKKLKKNFMPKPIA